MNIGSNRQLSGENWGRYVDTTEGLVFGNWSSVTAVSASTINVAASNIGGTTTSISLIAGETLRGRISSLTVTSGAVVCRSSNWQKGPGGLYTSPSQFSYDDYAVWSGFGVAVGSFIASGSTAPSNLGKTITITSSASTVLRQQPTSWLGNFQSGEYVVLASIPVTLSVSVPVFGLGLEVQNAAINRPFTAVATVFDSSNNPIATDMSFGFSTLYPNPKGYTAFVGYQSGSASISKIRIYTTESSSINFGFGKLLIKT